MKSLNIAFAMGALILVSAPAVAQLSGTDTQAFVDAVQKRDGAKATDLLATHPTIVDTKDANGDTGLIITLRASDQDWAGFLLNKGADPNTAGANGDTPLITAAKASFDQAAEWLIGLGAKVDADEQVGRNAIDHCGPAA